MVPVRSIGQICPWELPSSYLILTVAFTELSIYWTLVFIHVFSYHFVWFLYMFSHTILYLLLWFGCCMSVKPHVVHTLEGWTSVWQCWGGGTLRGLVQQDVLRSLEVCPWKGLMWFLKDLSSHSLSGFWSSAVIISSHTLQLYGAIARGCNAMFWGL